MSWSTIRGHDRIVQQLTAAYTHGRFGQAYLFAGPAGVGKHLFATELAKALLCESSPAPLTACDRCPGCVLAAADNHPDLLSVRKPGDKNEMPIDSVREFMDHLSMMPSRGRRKIGVMHDADTLNASSANVFLKTLEEPPPGTLLVLLATNTEEQLPTVLSRCQVVRFRPLPDEAVAGILAANGVDDAATVGRLVKLARGSAGLALQLNDADLWTFRETLLDKVCAAKPDADALASLWQKFVDDAGKEAADQRVRLSLVLRLLADLASAALRVAVGYDAPEDARVTTFAERAGPDRLTDVIEACVEADYHVDRRVQLALIIEATAIAACRA